jgi:hypothetical protein
MMAGERQQVREAIAAYFGGSLVTADAGICYQGGPLASYGLTTCYAYTPKGIPDPYFFGAPGSEQAGRGFGMILGIGAMVRETGGGARIRSWGGPTSGWRQRDYTITCEIEMQSQLPHIEAAGAALDDLIDQLHGLIYADRTLGTTNAGLYPINGRLIQQAGEKPFGIRDETTPMVPMGTDERGRYWGSGRLMFVANTMVQG